MATVQEILDKINASKSNNVNNNSFIDLMRQISGNPEDATAPVNDTNSIYGHIVQMYTTLYDSGVDYAVLADDIEAIQGLYERLNTIDSLYADKIKLDSLYADKIKLDQLFADKAVIDRVYGSITNIDRVYTSIDKLDTVYTSVLKMDTVADNIADVNTVADNMIVLNEIYDNIVEIYAADNNATVATTKAIEASNSATIATTKASEASASALAASTASNTSTSKATESAASAVLANTSAGSANTSAASASSNATIATTKASEASVSASNASTNAANASTSASAAAVSASTSATKAIEAATSASTALGYKNDVSTMKLAIETIYDTFDDRFLGTKTTNPLVDNDGNVLLDGALYFDTTINAMKVYDVGTSTWYAMPQIHLNSLLDVELTSLTTGNILVWNGTKWINYTLSKADVGLNNVENTADNTKNVLSATKLTTARTIGGVSFDGTSNINLPGVNATGNQSTTGNSATATKLQTARTITLSGDSTGSVTFDGSANANIVVTRSTANMLSDILAVDGAGSGIDADLLDGQHGSYYGTAAAVALNTAKVSNVSTNLSYTTAATTGTVVSSDGTNATIPAASTSLAGLMTNVDKTKLDGIASGAQVNVATNLSVIAGTTAGPIVTSSTGTNATLPSASATASGVVTTGAQTFAGAKTFSSGIVGTLTGSITGNSATATTLATARTINGVSFNGSANITISDSTKVALTGNETIAGIKTFSSSPIVPTPTDGTQAVNKNYADLKVALSDFTGANVNLTSSGYQKLPSGLIIQWGVHISSASEDSNITFPIAFPTSAQIVLGIVQANPSQGVIASIGAAGISSTRFYMGSWASNSIRVATPTSWIAIGH